MENIYRNEVNVTQPHVTTKLNWKFIIPYNWNNHWTYTKYLHIKHKTGPMHKILKQKSVLYESWQNDDKT